MGGSTANRPGEAPGESSLKQGVLAHFDGLARSGTWSGLYDGPETSANHSFRMRLTRAVELLPHEARSILDVGCGPAPLAIALRARGSRYVGLDLSAEMLSRARLREGGVRLVRGSLPLPFRDEAFDAVVALGFVEYFEDPESVLRELSRVAKTGGVLVVSVPKRHHLSLVTVTLTAPLRALAGLLLGRRSDAIRRTLLDPNELDAAASRAGIVPDGGCHYHFTLLPYPFTTLTPAMALRVNRRFESSAPSAPWAYSAQGYIGRYRRG